MFLEKNNFCNGLRNSINKPENENPNNKIFIAKMLLFTNNYTPFFVILFKIFYPIPITQLHRCFYQINFSPATK